MMTNLPSVLPGYPSVTGAVVLSNEELQARSEQAHHDARSADLHWIEAAGLEEGKPLFVPMLRNDRGDRLTRRDVACIYKRRVGEAFSAHSTRVGGAIDQRAPDITTGQIAQAGGWKCDAMPARYTRHIAGQESGTAILAGY